MPVRLLAGLIFFVFEPNNPIPGTPQTNSLSCVVYYSGASRNQNETLCVLRASQALTRRTRSISVISVLWLLSRGGHRGTTLDFGPSTFDCTYREQACKPNSVSRRGGTAIIHLAPALLAGSSDLPGSCNGAGSPSSPIWSCSVWGLPCPRYHYRSGALLL